MSASKENKCKTKSRNKKLGRQGEEAAARYLVKRGYDILERNWTCWAGEVDIIALDEETLVFVEVKTRVDSHKGFPAEAVTQEKRDRYERIAMTYLTEFDDSDRPIRFDVISLMVLSEEKALVRHHINAFSTL